MTDPTGTDPKVDPAARAAAPATAEPRFALLVMCTECGQGTEAPLPLDRVSLERFLAKIGWYTAVLTPPDQGPEVPILLSALCASCSPNVFPPEVMKVAEERRQQLLQEKR